MPRDRRRGRSVGDGVLGVAVFCLLDEKDVFVSVSSSSSGDGGGLFPVVLVVGSMAGRRE